MIPIPRNPELLEQSPAGMRLTRLYAATDGSPANSPLA